MAGVRKPRRSDYYPANALAIHYQNFQGQEKTFTADRETLQRNRNHIRASVAPTGEAIYLSRDRIQNLSEVDEALRQVTAPQEEASSQPRPTARERQVLSFHMRYKSTSPLYEKIRAKYPDWVPPDLRKV